MAGRTLIFNFDGTGNEPSDAREFHEDESISNIAKLHVMLGGRFEKRSEPVMTPAGTEQYAHYQSGIGTRESNAAWKLINKAFAPSWGDVKEILEEAHEQFDEHKYTPDDKVAIFGFSRGAALARKFASQLLKKHENCRVSFLGVFDTVAAMNGVHREGEKLSTDVLFEDGTLHRRIERAVHIVSLDEDRVAFTPTLINRDDSNPERILEVWFPGVHSDVGGGYWFDGLSDLALRFMIRECHKTLGKHIMIEETADKLSDILSKLPTSTGLTVDDVHLYPMADGVLHASPGANVYDRKARRIQVWRDDEASQRPKDVPLLHQSVKVRFELVTEYRPVALRGLRFQILLRGGERKGPLEGISGLRDYILSPGDMSADTTTPRSRLERWFGP